MGMALEFETISQEKVAPSTPTPPHLKTYKLSYLDQSLTLLEYSTPMVFFCASLPRDKDNVVTRLKQSLSKTLSLYYPLAGRLITHESIIDCNDEGVPLVVTRANCSLFAFLRDPNKVNLIPQFVPKDDTFLDPRDVLVKGLVPAAFQITTFSCGGFAVGSHSINMAIDGTSWARFFQCWTAMITSTGDKTFQLDFITKACDVFPPVPNANIFHVEVPPVLQPIKGEMTYSVVKPFMFSRNSIAGLQAMAKSDTIPNPTRVESVSCFIWKHLMAASGQGWSRTSSTIIHSVNIRTHLNPRLPPTSFGRYVSHAFANWENKQGGTVELRDLVVLLREAFSKVKDKESLGKLLGNKSRNEASRQHKKTLHEFMPTAYFFASLMGFDKLDFGSGAPVWTAFTGDRVSSYFRNFIPLIHTSNRGIEAWLILDEKEMVALESDQEFVRFATPNGASTFPPKASLEVNANFVE